ncbi:MAG TPA: hypothetical protein VFS30_00045 [Dehalococcoidia bacterium]|nr:hypothetical protein [Dehalococcoidia bacterium]
MIILTPLSFEVVVTVVLVCAIVFEGLDIWLRRGARQGAVARPGNGVSQGKRVFWIIAEFGAICFAALLMHNLAGVSALASLLVVAVGVVSAVSFWRLTE